jgi:hypothetical protein
VVVGEVRNGGCFLTLDLKSPSDTGHRSSADATADRRATFFVTATFARDNPGVVFGVGGRGHEVACHGGRSELAFVQGRDAFRAALTRSVTVLEDVANQRVIGFRAAEPLTGTAQPIALEGLAACGLAYDSSVVGTGHRAASAPFDAYPIADRTVSEFPLYRAKLPGRVSVMAVGATAFRRLPVVLLIKLMQDAARAGYVPVIRLDAGAIGPRQKSRLAALLEFFPNRGPMAEAVPGLNSVADLRCAALRLIA